MTPVAEATTNAAKQYNRVHAKTSAMLERCIGALKTRFRCLSGKRKLMYNHEHAANIIVSCVFLYNFLRRKGEIGNHENVMMGENNVNDDGKARKNKYHSKYEREGQRVRDELINSFSEE